LVRATLDAGEGALDLALERGLDLLEGGFLVAQGLKNAANVDDHRANEPLPVAELGWPARPPQQLHLHQHLGEVGGDGVM
jgi:hypothetical protein